MTLLILSALRIFIVIFIIRFLWSIISNKPSSVKTKDTTKNAPSTQRFNTKNASIEDGEFKEIK